MGFEDGGSGGSRGGLRVVAVADDGRVHGQEHFAQFRGRLQAVLQAQVFKHRFLAALAEGEVGDVGAFQAAPTGKPQAFVDALQHFLPPLLGKVFVHQAVEKFGEIGFLHPFEKRDE